MILGCYAFFITLVLIGQSLFPRDIKILDYAGKVIYEKPASAAAMSGLASILVKCIFSVAQSINPLLPVSLAMGQSASSSRLGETGLMCLAPQRVPMAGVVDTMVLDKTGTITQEGMELHAIQP